MARVYIDVSVWGQEWFQNCLGELASCPSVVFVECEVEKMKVEIQRVVQLRSFLSRLQKLPGRVEIAPLPDVAAALQSIAENAAWRACNDCDDEHVFAVSGVKNVRFVFTNDLRMGKCQKRMRGSIDSKFLRFTLITNQHQLQQKRHAINA